MFNTAVNRIDKELDIVDYIKLQKIVRILSRHLFTDVERYLIRNQQSFVINSDCNGKSSSET